MKELIEIETSGWKALSTDSDTAIQFYKNILAEDASMIFPGGLRICGKDEILESFSQQTWTTFSISSEITIKIEQNVFALIYRARAKRKNQEEYLAEICSIYVNTKNGFKLKIHQHTKA